MGITQTTRKPLRRKKRSRGASEPEKILRAIQGVAGAAVVAYKVFRPHLKKLKKKKLKKGGPPA